MGKSVPSTWSNPQGLLYNYAAATLGAQDDVLTFQEVQNTTSVPGPDEVENTGPMGTVPHKYVRGICPPEWHIPSDREWNDLEEYLYNNAPKVSTYTEADMKNTSIWSPATWDSSWNMAINYRGSNGTGGHAWVMQSPCILSGFPDTKGKSKPRTEGGFNMLFTGFAVFNVVYSYGQISHHWASSIGNSATAVIRGLSIGDGDTDIDRPKVKRSVIGRWNLLSVRCKAN